MIMMDMKRKVKNIGKVMFIYLIFAFIGKTIRKNGPSEKSEFVFSRD